MIKKILIVDDHDLIRDGLVAILRTEQDFEIAGQTGSGQQALEMVKTLRPHVLLLDLSMPDMDGMEVLRLIKESEAEVKVLVLTVHEDESLLREALRLGAAGYIIKRAASAELVEAIRYILDGHIYVHPTLTRSILKNEFTPISTSDNNSLLTSREAEVLRLIVRGYTNREISHLLTITIRTVEKHRGNILRKIGAHNRSDLLEFARKNNLI